jgi:hypothetical protein
MDPELLREQVALHRALVGSGHVASYDVLTRAASRRALRACLADGPYCGCAAGSTVSRRRPASGSGRWPSGA